MTPATAPPCCRRSIVKGQEKLVIETSAGQHITLDTASSSVLIEDTNGNAVRLDSSGITITSAARLVINAFQIELAASAITVNAPITNFGGIVRADTVQAQTVIATSIVPGGNNVW
jgi:phage baseplate assembly protein gpV